MLPASGPRHARDSHSGLPSYCVDEEPGRCHKRIHCGSEGVAHFLNSSLNKSQVQEVKDDLLGGVTKLLYVAPESLNKEDTKALLRQIRISFYAIDEAHCISEWGHDFRPEYRNIRSIVDELGSAPIIALTATATPKVQAGHTEKPQHDGRQSIQKFLQQAQPLL